MRAEIRRTEAQFRDKGGIFVARRGSEGTSEEKKKLVGTGAGKGSAIRRGRVRRGQGTRHAIAVAVFDGGRIRK